MNVIVRRNPLRVEGSLLGPTGLIDRAERLARDMWNSSEPLVFYGGTHPSLDMYEEKDDVVVKAELPGIDKDGLEISLEEGTLHIKAEKKSEEEAEDKKFYVRERFYGHYHRSLTMPFPVDAEKTSATFEKGVLEIRLPKAEEARTKHIEIKAE